MKSPVNQKYCFLLFMLCYKDMQHTWRKHHPLSLSVAQPVKIEFHVSLIFIDSMQYFIDFHSKNGYSIFLPNRICPGDWRVCFQVLVVYFCLMWKFGYVPYTHKTWSQKFLHITQYIPIYVYIYIHPFSNWYASQVRQTQTDVWSDSFSTLFNTLNLPKSALPQRPGLYFFNIMLKKKQ